MRSPRNTTHETHAAPQLMMAEAMTGTARAGAWHGLSKLPDGDCTRAGSSMVEHPLFQADKGGSIPTSALRFVRCSSRRFAACNRLWHRTQPRIGAINTLRPCFAAVHEGTCLAVAAWSNPVARALPQSSWLELRRFAVGPDAPQHTASRMLGWMVREIRRTMPRVEVLISYQDCDEHTGTIYRAAGWEPQAVGRGGDWCNRQRFDRVAQRRDNKIRWEKRL